MKRRLHLRGFTLIEIVLVVMIIAILAVSAITYFQNFRAQALATQESGVVGAVRSGIKNYYAESLSRSRTPLYPQLLDAAPTGAAGATNPLFANVLIQGITSDWSKVSSDTYRGPTGNAYRYDAADGSLNEAPAYAVNEDFSSGLSGWHTYGPNISTLNGALLFNTGENRAFTGDAAWTDYTVETDATLTAGTGYGVFFRVSREDPVNGYTFQYDPGWNGGSFVMRQWVNGHESAPFAQVKAPAGFTWNGVQRHVSVEVSGNTFKASIDGQLVLTGSNSAFSSGSAGLRSWVNSSASFDTFQVTLH